MPWANLNTNVTHSPEKDYWDVQACHGHGVVTRSFNEQPPIRPFVLRLCALELRQRCSCYLRAFFWSVNSGIVVFEQIAEVSFTIVVSCRDACTTPFTQRGGGSCCGPSG
jgi:hypothetical protein